MLRSKPSGSSIKDQNDVETIFWVKVISHVHSNKNLDDPKLNSKSQGLLKSAYAKLMLTMTSDNIYYQVQKLPVYYCTHAFKMCRSNFSD